MTCKKRRIKRQKLNLGITWRPILKTLLGVVPNCPFDNFCGDVTTVP